LKTPIVFIIFNRSVETSRVFEVIRQVQPLQLFVIADGPRTNKEGEVEKCNATREIINKVDWDCEVITNYSDVNLGCKERIYSGLSWAFSIVEEAIILEDDCLPDPSFFRFCEELLEYYRDNKKIASIGGQNVQFGRKRTNYSYYFSRYFHCWGWATWKRAWQQYDISMKQWPQVRDSNLLQEILVTPRAVKYWQKMFKIVYEGRKDTWDYQWLYSNWVQGKLNIVPNVNLVSNIGFSTEATNTTTRAEDNLYAHMSREVIDFPLKHPPTIGVHRKADEFTQATMFTPNFLTKVRAKVNKTLGIRSI